MSPLLPLVLVLAAADTPVHVAVGEVAPDFSLAASNGKTVKLSDYRGKKKVVLAFFPKAFTGG
jgi:thioredoxin-dependent peroxiredoxin